MSTETLNPKAAEALHCLERAFAPASSPLMSFPTLFGATVEVIAVDDSSAPYRWSCSAGHRGVEPYASLPFCRDDARAHAAECVGLPPAVVKAVTRYEVASSRTAELSAAMESRDLTPAEFTALEFAQDTMRESRATLAEAGMLDLIGGA